MSWSPWDPKNFVIFLRYLGNVLEVMSKGRKIKIGVHLFQGGVDAAIAGLLAVTDPMKATVPSAIEAPHQLGIKIIMLTGDNIETKRILIGLGWKIGIASVRDRQFEDWVQIRRRRVARGDLQRVESGETGDRLQSGVWI